MTRADDTLRWRELDRRHHLHPFTNPAELASGARPRIITRAEGCTIPAAWSEIHHRRPWSEGGGTDVDDGVCLCSHHHHLVHGRRYESTWLPNGDVRFRMRT